MTLIAFEQQHYETLLSKLESLTTKVDTLQKKMESVDDFNVPVQSIVREFDVSDKTVLTYYHDKLIEGKRVGNAIWVNKKQAAAIWQPRSQS